MAIQHRRGGYSDFDPTKMKPGEYAVMLSGDPQATDGEGVYMAVGAGRVKRIATLDELHSYDNDARQGAEDAEASRVAAENILQSVREAVRFWTATDPSGDGNIVIGGTT